MENEENKSTFEKIIFVVTVLLKLFLRMFGIMLQLLILYAFLVSLYSVYDTLIAPINVIKEATPNNSNITYEQAFDNFFANGKWTSAGSHIVQFEGQCRNDNNEILTVLIQWTLEESGTETNELGFTQSTYSSCEITYMGINNEPLNYLEAGLLMLSIFGS